MLTGAQEVALPRYALPQPCARRDLPRQSCLLASPATQQTLSSDFFAASAPVAPTRSPGAEVTELRAGRWSRSENDRPSHEAMELFQGFAARGLQMLFDMARKEAAQVIQARWRARRTHISGSAQSMPHALTGQAALTASVASVPPSSAAPLHPQPAPPSKPVPPPSDAQSSRCDPRRRIAARQLSSASSCQIAGMPSSPVTPTPPAHRAPAAARVCRPGHRASAAQPADNEKPAPSPPAVFRLDDNDDEAREDVVAMASARSSSLARGYQTLGTEFHTLDSDTEGSTPRPPSTARGSKTPRHARYDCKEVSSPSSQPSWVKQVQQGSFFEAVKAERSSARSASVTGVPASTPRAVRPATAQRSSSLCYTASQEQRPSSAGSVTTNPRKSFLDQAAGRCTDRPQTARATSNPSAQFDLGRDKFTAFTSPRAKKAGTGLLPILATSTKSADGRFLSKHMPASATPRGDAKSLFF